LLICTFYTQSTNSIIIDYPLIKIFKLQKRFLYKLEADVVECCAPAELGFNGGEGV
jgi:hypothetical protein